MKIYISVFLYSYDSTVISYSVVVTVCNLLKFKMY